LLLSPVKLDLMNRYAIIHRDYFDVKGDVAVEKLSDRIFINNPGGITFPKEEFGIMSYPRNRLLADILSRTLFMEKAGTGIKRMKTESRSNRNELEIDFSEYFYFFNFI